MDAAIDVNRYFPFVDATCHNERVFLAMKVKIKELAKEKKDWSLYRLAKELGLPQQTVYSWASGRTQPSYDNMDRLCDILDCPVGDLFEAEPVQKKLF